MSGWYVGIRVEQSDIGIDFDALIKDGNISILRNFGHVMVTLTGPDGNTEVFGWMPNPSKAKNEPFTVPGQISMDQADHAWDFEKRIEATDGQVSAIRQYVAELNSILLADQDKSADLQRLRYYAAPSLPRSLQPFWSDAVIFNCVSFAAQCLSRAGINSLTNLFTPNLSPGAIPRDDADLRQKSALAGIAVWERRFTEGQAQAKTLIYQFGNNAAVQGTDENDFIVAKSNVSAGEGDDCVFGTAAISSIEGGGGDDVIDAAGGNDTLDGGSGNDTLYGGNDIDTYHFGANWGGDVIVDADGKGSIQQDDIGGINGAGARKVADGVWQTNDKKINYTLVGTTANRNDLIISFSDRVDTITVRGWSDGKLGVTLDETLAEPPAPVNTFSGDYTKKLDSSDPTKYVFDPYSNYASDGAQADAADIFSGSWDGDSLQGLAGNDGLDGLAGNDAIDGGEGHDLMFGGRGADTMVGGAGRDFIYGSGIGAIYTPLKTSDPPPVASGPEYTRGFSWVTYDGGTDANGIHNYNLAGAYGVAVSDDDGNLIDGGTGDDWIRAGSGNDFVHGGADNDNVVGLAGKDIVFGDDGNDAIWGDGLDIEGYIESVPGELHGSDILMGGTGNDTLAGQGEDDELYGGTGDDLMDGDDVDERSTPNAMHGIDYLDGGDGSDVLYGGGRDDSLFGGIGNDRLVGDNDAIILAEEHHGGDYLDGEEGDDSLVGGGGTDELFGGADNDMLWGDIGDGVERALDGDDYLDGEGGDDYLSGEAGNDLLVGGDGKDTVDGGKGDDELYGDAGADSLFGGDGNDVIDGEDGSDALVAGDGNDGLFGGNGADGLYGLAGADYLDGGDGNDELQGGDHDDMLYGGSGDDFVVGQVGDDLADGGDGNDEVQGNDGNDAVSGGLGDDRLFGMADNDAVIGDDGNDYVDGGDGGDLLDGGDGNDLVLGGTGNDTLKGGTGDDWLSGDSGVDTYTFGRGSGHDVIENNDPSSGTQDVLELSAGVDANDVEARQVGNDLVITIADSGDSATIRNHFLVTGGTVNSPSYGYQIGNIRFGDGTSWTPSTLPLYSSPSGGSVTVVGRNPNNDVFGGADGVVQFIGQGGSDVYLVGERSGQVTINDSSYNAADVDTLVFDVGIAPQDLALSRSGNDLVLRVAGSPDEVIVSRYFQGSYNDGVDRVQFRSDGTVWDRSTIATRFTANSSGPDQVIGTAGDDTLTGLAGDDTLMGAAGNDTYVFAPGGGTDQILGEDNNSGALDAISFDEGISPTNVRLARDGEDLTLSVGLADSVRVAGYFHDYGNGAIGTVENVRFADGTVWDASAIRARLPSPTNAGEVHHGYETADLMSGLGGDDTLHGGRGDDTLDGGAGSDLLVGGAGNNTYLFDIGSGVDTIDTTASGNRTNTVRIGPGFRVQDTVASRSGNDLLLWQQGVSDQLRIRGQFASSPVDQVVFAEGTMWDSGVLGGLSWLASLNGSLGNDSLTGSTGSETLSGYAGNDTLDGRSGNDTLVGGTGSDSYVAYGAGDVIVENAGEGLDSVQSSGTYTLPTNVENLSLTGSGAYSGTGNALDNVITGNVYANLLSGADGNDTLQGNGGIDTLAGGRGDDLYAVVDPGTVISENASEGVDAVNSTVSLTLGANLENLTLAGASAINGTGNTTANTLQGNSAANTLDGAAGVDTMHGGAGDDVYIVDNASDVVVESAGEGVDTVQSSIGYTLSANVENLTLTGSSVMNATGNDQDNVLTGNSANNVLNGGKGNDTYAITSGDTIIENSGEGTDTVVTASTYTLAGTNLENLTLTGTSRINGTGNAFGNVIVGNSANNALTGGDGNDRLVGNGGTDTLAGGKDDDTYVIDDSRDSIVENANEGTDTVETAFAYTLATNLENLVLAAGAAINGIGNVGNNVVTGNELTNVLDGGAGADTLVGSTGNDTYIVDNVGDVITELANEGIDTVQSSVAYTVAANVDNLTLTGTSAINGTGNTLDNTITGNGAANVMAGGAGNDTYVVGSGDTVIELAGEGVDTVQSSLAYTLVANLENLTLTGSSAINGTGNDLDNVMTGNSAANVLTGGKGNDTYVVGSGDSAVEVAGEGLDTVLSSVTFTLGANVEHLALTGTAAINGTGNALDNVITGNDGANVLSGGDGNDTYVAGAGDSVDESGNAGGGFDTVQSAATFTLAAYVENLTLTGAAAINGTGNGLGNRLTGNTAANQLDGGVGQDTMTGGAGDDTFLIDDAGDVVIENAGGGTDTVKSTISYVAGANIENVTLTGAAPLEAIGNGGNNVLTGNSGANRLAGGAGDDTYVVDAADTLVESAGEGIDTVQASINWTLGDNLENLVLAGIGNVNGTGNAFANRITGNAGNNWLEGAGGRDTLDGGAGNDTLVGNADAFGQGPTLIGGGGDDLYVWNGSFLYVENYSGAFEKVGGSGIDTVQTANGAWLQDYATLDGHWVGTIENAELTGNANAKLRGNDLNNVLKGNAGNNELVGLWGNDSMYGNDGNDSLYGYYGNDLMDGGAGDDLLEGVDGGATEVDTLVGGAGNDTLSGNGTDSCAGGTGDDSYRFYGTTVILTENAGEGTDTVYSDISYTLLANFENLTLNDGAGSINATGNAADNVLTGNSYANVLTGGLGNDTYVVGTGDSVVENANEGVDTVKSGLTYTLGANLENLVLTGTSAISGTGNAMANVLTGNSAANVLTGGQGNDTYVIDALDTVVENAGEGTDTVQAGSTYTLGVDLENLTLTGTAAINGTGNAAANSLTGNGANNQLDGGAGVDTLAGGLGNDTYLVDNTADTIVENGAEGRDTVLSAATFTLGANVENLTLTGSSAVNGTGNGLDNVLGGNSGANVLTGGAGNDTYVITDVLDTVVENANEGVDTVQSSGNYTLGANVENLVLTGSARVTATGNALGNTLTGNGAGDTLAGGLGDDVYFITLGSADLIVESANEGTDTVQTSFSYTLAANVENLVLLGSAFNGTGNALANVLTGNSLFNRLDGAVGADTMAGGEGNDTYVVDNVGDVVAENAGDGVDTVESGIGYTLSTNVENLTLTGIGAVNGVGNALANVLLGNSASNVLQGGAGDDAYGVGMGDTVVENANEGVDTVTSDVSWTLGANLENLTLTGVANVDANGNALDNVLTGNIGSNVLTGGLGNDTYVITGGSNDTLVELADEGVDTVQSDLAYTLGANFENLTLTGTSAINGTGNALDNVLTGNSTANVLSGGAGNDTYLVGNGDAVVEQANEGIDSVMSSVTFVLADNVEDLTLTGTAAIDGTGNALDNVLVGNAGNNALDGQAGINQMSGGAGNDTYTVRSTDDVVVESANEGLDTVQSFIDYTLGQQMENLALTGVTAVNGTGNALDNTITGTVVDNALSGLAGNDTLDGYWGADTLTGGTGNDTYVVDNVGDVIVEEANEGIDTVQSKIDYALGGNVENLTLLGMAAVRGTGNVANNVLTGGIADNVLDGGAGADTMSGGGGDDAYYVDDAADLVTENASEGVDTVYSSANFALAANVENLTLIGQAATDATGNSLANVLVGNAAANVLRGNGGGDRFDGGAGADTMIGGSTADTYVVDNAGDVIQEVSGTDTVLSSLSYVLATDLENLTLTGAEAIDGAGNTQVNVLRGNDAANILDGGASADVMMGGAGDDTYVVDDVGDWIGEWADEGVDTVRSGVTRTLAANVENLVLTGNAAVDGTDNALDNWLVGNEASNTLTASAGNDTLAGGAGADRLSDSAGNNVLIGGAGADTASGGTGSDVYAFNRGDGSDIVWAGAGTDTLSLGGGISYADMTLAVSGSDMVLGLGGGDQIVLKDWYAALPRRVTTLQVFAGAMSDFEAGGADPLRDNKIETFDFAALAARFDDLRAANSQLTSWSPASSMVDFLVGGNDTTAVGGSVAYDYGLSGALPIVGETPTLAASAAPLQQAMASESASVVNEAVFDDSMPPLTALNGVPRATGQESQGTEAAAVLQTPSGVAHTHTSPEETTVVVAPQATIPSMMGREQTAAVQPPSSAEPQTAMKQSTSQFVGSSEVKFTSSSDAPSPSKSLVDGTSSPLDEMLDERIERVMQHWTDLQLTSPDIRLSHYQEVLDGVATDSTTHARSIEASSSYAGQWRRMRTLLDRHEEADGAEGAALAGSFGWRDAGMAALAGDDNAGWHRGDPGQVSLKRPLPVFSGLQEGFERL